MGEKGITIKGPAARALLWVFRLHCRYDDFDANHQMLRFGIAMAILSPAFLIADGRFAVEHLGVTIACCLWLMLQAILRLAYLMWRP